MDAIYNNSSSINLLNNNSKDITLLNNKSIINENKNNTTKTTTKIDAIEINQKNQNIINKKKAYDAFNDACSEYNKTSSENDSAKIKIQYYMIAEMMNSDSSNVPSFNLDDNANGDAEFLPFIDKMKDFIKKNNIIHNGASMDKTEFLDFCDLYKGKLVEYNCK